LAVLKADAGFQVPHNPTPSFRLRLPPTTRQLSTSTRLRNKQPVPKIGPDDPSKNASKAKIRPTTRQTSLRRAALEAERARGNLIRKKGNIRFIDPDAETQVCHHMSLLRCIWF
jgi:hypothetical protein